jgi:hypothetical protein
MSKIVIQVSGGIVQDVFIIQKEVRKLRGAVIVDFDSDGDIKDPKITTVDKNLYAYVDEVNIKQLPADSDVQKLLTKYFKDDYEKLLQQTSTKGLKCRKS